MAYVDASGVTRIAAWANGKFALKSDISTLESSLAAVATSGDYDDLSGKPAEATTVASGLMSAADKAKLDGMDLSPYPTTTQVQTMIDNALGIIVNGSY